MFVLNYPKLSAKTAVLCKNRFDAVELRSKLVDDGKFPYKIKGLFTKKKKYSKWLEFVDRYDDALNKYENNFCIVIDPKSPDGILFGPSQLFTCGNYSVVEIDEVLLTKPALCSLFNMKIGETLESKGYLSDRYSPHTLCLDGYFRAYDGGIMGFKELYKILSDLDRFKNNPNWLSEYLNLKDGDSFILHGHDAYKCKFIDREPYKLCYNDGIPDLDPRNFLCELINYPTNITMC